MMAKLLEIVFFVLSILACAGAQRYTHAEALAKIQAVGITISSSGGCSDRNSRKCTSLDQIRTNAIDANSGGIIKLKTASGCEITITGGTEEHTPGTFSHGNGYKIDIRPNTCVDNYITSSFSFIGNRKSDGARQYKSAAGVIYAKEGNHWDILYNVKNRGYAGPINEAGLNLIKSFDSFAPNFYYDAHGIRKIGYGHVCEWWQCSIPYTPPLTLAQGNVLFLSDIKRSENCVKEKITWPLNANQFSALTSFVFNAGCASLGVSTLRVLLNQGDTLGASKEFKIWGNDEYHELSGLIARREAERVLFCSSGGCEIESCRGKLLNADFTLPVKQDSKISSEVIGTLYTFSEFIIYGMKLGENVNGNSYWYSVSTNVFSLQTEYVHDPGYVPAYYVELVSSTCGKIIGLTKNI